LGQADRLVCRLSNVAEGKFQVSMPLSSNKFPGLLYSER
jgi:hypothetical protein